MQISVATYVSDRPIFRQNAQKPQGVPWGGSLVGCGLLAVSTCRKPNTGCNHPATGMGFVRDEPTQRPYLRGQDRITLYRTPSLWNSNSRSGLMMLNSSRPNSRNPSIIAEHSSSFSGLGFFSRFTVVFLRSACLAFFAPAWSSLGSSYNFSPRSIALSSSINSIASSRLMFKDFISFWIFSSTLSSPFCTIIIAQTWEFVKCYL